jgi:hypothetical protein
MRKTLLLATALGLAAAGLTTTPAAAAATVTPDSALNNLFNTYGNGAGCADWSGSDGTQSALLPSGKRAWFFSDSYLGSPSKRADGFSTSPLRNSIVIQSGQSLRTITGGNTCQEGSFSYAKTPVTDPTDASAWYWSADSMVVGSNLVKFFYRNKPAGNFWTTTNAAVAVIPTSTLDTATTVNIAPTAIPVSNTTAGFPIIWGSSLLASGNFVYIYGWGTVDANADSELFVARVAPSGLANPSQWQFNRGGGQDSWSAAGDQAAAGPISGTFVEAGGSVVAANGQFWLIAHEPNLNGGPIVAYPSATPFGFGANRVVLYNPPEGARGAANGYRYYYEARVQPGLGAAGTLVVSYNVNTTAVSVGCMNRATHDPTYYRPRFIDVPTSLLTGTGTPAGAAAKTTPDRGIVAGRGVIAGRAAPSAPAEVSPRGTQAAATPPPAGGDQSWYDQFAAPLQANSGCPTLVYTVRLSGTANTDGTASLSWDNYGMDMWYWIYSRDVTAGQTTFTRSALWTTVPSSRYGLVPPGVSGHRYEVYVQPFGEGAPASVGLAPPSNTISLVVSKTT